MTGEEQVRAMQQWIVTIDEDTLQALVSVSIAELAVRYGSEVIEDVITGMFLLDEFHELAEKAREERREIIEDFEATEMVGHDIVAEARAILDES